LRGLTEREKMLYQTDLYSFSYKKGSLTAWCKRCGAENFYKDGKNSQGRQLYLCKKCGFRFVWRSDLPNRRFFSSVIGFAVGLYSTIGVSLRTLSSKLMHFFDIRISHEGIRQWVLAGKKQHFVDDKVDNCQTWHVDETYIKIKGRGRWLWVVYCKETKQVLSWLISEGRFFKHAKAVLLKAKQAAGGRPQFIVSDGLYQYDAAI
jgi:transposase-like protein